ncbi:transposase [Patescibacteria group bacterium]|nr:transposase [Patescibacteria group bacterium]
MTRKARNLLSEEGVYHIYNRGNNGATIFNTEDDFSTFINLIRNCKQKYSIQIFHYCLMENHYHLMIKADGDNLSKAMKWINHGYSMKHRVKYCRQGRLWQSRYQSRIIDSEKYLLTCVAYIELNPVFAGLVNKPDQYTWSSYKKYAFGIHNSLIDIDPEYLNLAVSAKSRQKIYREVTKIWMANQKLPVPFVCRG